MSENQFVNADKKKLFTFLSYSWTLDNMIYGELAKEYGSLNKDDINNFREEIIAQLNTQEEDINFVKTYREIEKKINENHANDKLKEIYLEEIIEFCKTQKKPKRLEIIDELKLHLSKCEDGEILDFFKSIDGEIDKKSETNNKKILKEIWGRYETDSMIEISNPEIEKILQSDFMLNAVDAVRDEAIKSELKEIANQAQPFDSAPPITTADNNDFLGLGKFLSDVINLGRDAEKAISKFIPRGIENVSDALDEKNSPKSVLASLLSVANVDSQIKISDLNLQSVDIAELLKNACAAEMNKIDEFISDFNRSFLFNLETIIDQQFLLQEELKKEGLSDKQRLEITQKLLSPFELDKIKLKNKEFFLDHPNDQLKKLESLIQNHPDQNDKLILALKNSDVELARIALDRGADVNATIIPDHPEYRPIHYVTTITGNVEMTKLLLEKGADVNALFEGKTCLDGIAKKGNQELITLLKSYDDKTNNPQTAFPSRSPSRTGSSSGVTSLSR